MDDLVLMDAKLLLLVLQLKPEYVHREVNDTPVEYQERVKRLTKPVYLPFTNKEYMYNRIDKVVIQGLYNWMINEVDIQTFAPVPDSQSNDQEI